MITPMVLAHRGWSSRAPENSLEAMKLASVSGADGVELDIHETLDGGFVVHHDPDVPHGLITALPLSFIIGHAGKHGAPVSSLTEVLGTLAERLPGATVFIEVKAMRSWSRLRSLLRPYRNDLDLEIQSFDTWILKDVAKSADGFPLGWIPAARQNHTPHRGNHPQPRRPPLRLDRQRSDPSPRTSATRSRRHHR